MLPTAFGPSMMSRALALTLSLPVLATIVELVPGLDAALIYDRARAFGSEPWRILTGHLVHATPQLFAYNVGALVTLAFACERVLPGIAARAAWSAVFAVSLIALPLSPEIAQYDGLSAAASALGAAACVGLVLRARQRGERLPAWLAIGVAIAFLAKLAHERFVGTAVFAGTDTRPWAEAHLVGALLGGLAAARTKLPPRQPNDSRTGSHHPAPSLLSSETTT